MRQLSRFLAVIIAALLFVTPAAMACDEAAMVCGVLVAAGCDEMPGAETAADSLCHTDDSAVMECCEFDTESVATDPFKHGASSTLEALSRVAALPGPDSPRPKKAASSSSLPRSNRARLVLLGAFLL